MPDDSGRCTLEAITIYDWVGDSSSLLSVLLITLDGSKQSCLSNVSLGSRQGSPLVKPTSYFLTLILCFTGSSIHPLSNNHLKISTSLGHTPRILPSLNHSHFLHIPCKTIWAGSDDTSGRASLTRVQPCSIMKSCHPESQCLP